MLLIASHMLPLPLNWTWTGTGAFNQFLLVSEQPDYILTWQNYTFPKEWVHNGNTDLAINQSFTSYHKNNSTKIQL